MGAPSSSMLALLLACCSSPCSLSISHLTPQNIGGDLCSASAMDSAMTALMEADRTGHNQDVGGRLRQAWLRGTSFAEGGVGEIPTNKEASVKLTRLLRRYRRRCRPPLLAFDPDQSGGAWRACLGRARVSGRVWVGHGLSMEGERDGAGSVG
jgi:hypothetical protein